MGMYTGLRCKAIIKKEYRDEIFKIINEIDWKESTIDFFREYGECDRADFIPFGVLSYMPDEWENSFSEFNGNIDKNGCWSFKCSLQNNNTIEYFFEKVLSKIAEDILYLEVYYETWTYSTSYKLENNKIIVDNPQFKRYI